MKKVLLFNICLILLVSFGYAQESQFNGHWKTDGSSVEYDVTIQGGVVRMRAVDQSDGEVLEVSDARLRSEDRLSFHLHTPSTKWDVDCEFKLLSAKKLEETVTGDGEATMIYEQTGPSELPADEAGATPTKKKKGKKKKRN